MTTIIILIIINQLDYDLVEKKNIKQENNESFYHLIKYENN